mmetsp:Transcript_8764/g.19588  ORF Transcript_8764/g.19588 Transcript_8764/m.19588 type:complete len:238 (-) Transcript_8764:1221-1934(-)
MQACYTVEVAFHFCGSGTQTTSFISSTTCTSVAAGRELSACSRPDSLATASWRQIFLIKSSKMPTPNAPNETTKTPSMLSMVRLCSSSEPAPSSSQAELGCSFSNSTPMPPLVESVKAHCSDLKMRELAGIPSPVYISAGPTCTMLQKPPLACCSCTSWSLTAAASQEVPMLAMAAVLLSTVTNVLAATVSGNKFSSCVLKLPVVQTFHERLKISSMPPMSVDMAFDTTSSDAKLAV